MLAKLVDLLLTVIALVGDTLAGPQRSGRA